MRLRWVVRVRVMARGWTVLLGFVLVGAVSIGPSAVAQRSGASGDPVATLKRAVGRNDLDAMAEAMKGLLASDEGGAPELAQRVLERGTVAQRAVTASVLGQYGSVEDIAAIATGLDRGKYRDERRWLVGALGTRARELVASESKDRSTQLRAMILLILPFVEDQDLQVRATAIRALADTGTPAALLEAEIVLPTAPGIRERWGDFTEQGIMTWSVYGCVATLLGVRCESAAEVAACLRDRAGEIRAMEPGRVLTAPGSGVPGGAAGSVHFEIVERRPGVTERDLDRIADGVVASCRACFPGTYLPPLRLIITDESGLAKLGTPPRGFSGTWGGNTLAIVGPDRSLMLGMLAHEYALTIHSSQFIGQPRWLMEGLASSLTVSAQRPLYGPGGGAVPDELAALADRGTFQMLVKWTGEAVPNDEETARYHLAHLAIDYLRYRGFVEAEARLNVFMGMLSRGIPVERALEQVFDTPVERLDQDMRAWLRGG